MLGTGWVVIVTVSLAFHRFYSLLHALFITTTIITFCLISLIKLDLSQPMSFTFF